MFANTPERKERRTIVTPTPSKRTVTTAPSAQGAGSITVFGPRRFDRLPGAPRNQNDQFTLLGAPLTAYTILINNGAPNGANRVTGATILLNGTLLTTARSLDLQTGMLSIQAPLQTTNSLSVRITGAPNCYLTVTILERPRILSLVPEQGTAGTSVTINGEGFDPSAPNQNLVNFTKAGGGFSAAQVNSFTHTQLVVTVPSDATTGPVTVQHQGGTATSPVNFTVGVTPVMADFNPKRGDIGTVVTLTGMNLAQGNTPPAVTFAGSNNTRLPAVVTMATATEVRATVPSGAITGTIELTTAFGTAATLLVFSIEIPQDFQLTLAPSSTIAFQGSTANFVVTLSSNQSSFTQMATLSATGLPGTVTASFDPQQITAGATSNLTLVLPGNLAASTYNFTVQAKALINGGEQTRTATGALTVQTVGQTTIIGRVLNTKNEPIMGATASLDGKSATTDVAGNFLLAGVTAGTNRPLMIDGRTASAPNRTYPVIAEPINVVAGQVNAVPYKLYLPAIDTANEVTVVPNQTTVVTTPKVSGVTLTIPPDAGLTNRDGTPVTRASLTPVEIDRTPAPLPSNVGTNIVYTAQPGGARPAPGKVIPVTYPNLAGANSGTRIELWNFNHDTVQWYIYGYGNVSADGRTIVPEPGVGLPDFSWHFPNATPNGNPSPDSNSGGPCKDSCCGTGPDGGSDPNTSGGPGGPSSRCPNTSGDPIGPSPVGPSLGPHPVDLATGIKIEKTTDIAVGGARGGLELTRIYTSDLAQTCTNCAFGRGTRHNYDVRLTGTFTVNGAGRVVMPEEGTGRLFSYSRTESDGTLVFNTIATKAQLPDVVRKLPNNTFEYREGHGTVWRFDSTGRLTAIVDRNDNTTTLSYTGATLTSITDAVGRSITLQYSNGLIVRATDPLGRIWQYSYNGLFLISVTDPLGFSVGYIYAAGGLLTTITDRRGYIKKRLTYAPNTPRVIKQEFADGGFETYEYTFSGTVITQTKITDSLGRVETKRFNAVGYVVERQDALGQTSRVERDLVTNLAQSVTGPCGCVEVTQSFDDRGNLLSATDRLGQIMEYTYEPVFNFVTQSKDKLGRISQMSYDPKGNLISSTDALGRVTNLTYDNFGQLLTITDPLNHTTSYTYDTNGLRSTTTDALGNQTLRQSDKVGRLTQRTDPLGRTMKFTYDDNDRLLSSTDAAGVVTRYEYDQNGNRTAMINAQGKRWSFSYDAKNRLQQNADPLAQTTQYRYDTDDELVAMISPTGRITSYEYDARGYRTKMIDQLGGQTSFTYDSQGDLVSRKDERGNTTAFVYDPLYRMIAQRDPLGYVTSYAYDKVGNVIEKIDRLNRRTTRQYDVLNRAITINYLDATVSYTYDEAGRMTGVTDTQASGIQWTYDNADRRLSETTDLGSVNYTYNNANQRATMTVAGRPIVNYQYDTAGRLQNITQGTETFSWVYDNLSRLTELHRPNNVTTTYNYDIANKLSRIAHINLANVTLEDLQYQYNADDEIEDIVSLASGSLLPTAKTASAANAANRIPQFDQASYSFNDEGQPIIKPTAQGVTNYGWDARGRLATVTLPTGQLVIYSYDALGRRKSRTTDGVTTSFLYDGQDIVRDLTSSGSAVDYLNGLGIDQKLRQANTNDNLYFLSDHLGSTNAFANSLGNLVERAQSEAFGNGTFSLLSRYGFTGREQDIGANLYYYRARYYEPESGRFISEDPIMFNGGSNFYAYANNNPINSRDPLGLNSCQACYDEKRADCQFTYWATFSGAGLIAGAGMVSCIVAAAPASPFVAMGIDAALTAAILRALADLNACLNKIKYECKPSCTTPLSCPQPR